MDSFLGEADIDGDGRISLPEFQKLLRQASLGSRNNSEHQAPVSHNPRRREAHHHHVASWQGWAATHSSGDDGDLTSPLPNYPWLEISKGLHDRRGSILA